MGVGIGDAADRGRQDGLPKLTIDLVTAGRTVPNAVITALTPSPAAQDGPSFAIYNNVGTVDAVFDQSGYFVAPAGS